MATRFQDESEPEAVHQQKRDLGAMKITKVTVEKPPVDTTKVKPEIEESIRNAAQVMGGVNSMLRKYLYPACELAVALKNASDPAKIADARYTQDKKTYSVEVELKGKPMVVTVEIENGGVYAAVSDKKGNVVGYLQQDGKTLTVDGKGATLAQA